MIEEEKAEQEIRQWIDQNREHLPLGIEVWNIKVREKEKDLIETPILSFGKYNAFAYRTDSFYKPLSRFTNITNE